MDVERVPREILQWLNMGDICEMAGTLVKSFWLNIKNNCPTGVWCNLDGWPRPFCIIPQPHFNLSTHINEHGQRYTSTPWSCTHFNVARWALTSALVLAVRCGTYDGNLYGLKLYGHNKTENTTHIHSIINYVSIEMQSPAVAFRLSVSTEQHHLPLPPSALPSIFSRLNDSINN